MRNVKKVHKIVPHTSIAEHLYFFTDETTPRPELERRWAILRQIAGLTRHHLHQIILCNSAPLPIRQAAIRMVFKRELLKNMRQEERIALEKLYDELLAVKKKEHVPAVLEKMLI